MEPDPVDPGVGSFAASAPAEAAPAFMRVRRKSPHTLVRSLDERRIMPMNALPTALPRETAELSATVARPIPESRKIYVRGSHAGHEGAFDLPYTTVHLRCVLARVRSDKV